VCVVVAIDQVLVVDVRTCSALSYCFSKLMICQPCNYTKYHKYEPFFYERTRDMHRDIQKVYHFKENPQHVPHLHLGTTKWHQPILLSLIDGSKAYLARILLKNSLSNPGGFF
jgi:hypothetical protein